MKFRKMVAGGMLMAMLLSSGAQAACEINTTIEGSTLCVKWDAEDCSSSSCRLLVRQNGCLIADRSVDCTAGTYQMDLGCVSGSYQIEMIHNSACADSAPEASTQPSEKPQATDEPQASEKPQVTATPAATASPITEGGASISSMAQEVVNQVNAERAKNGLGALTVDANLTAAACIRAQEIVEKFSHTRPDGSSWSTVSSKAYGENIAKGQNSADKVMAAWLSSEGHRANILKSSFGSIGVCCYKRNGVYYWVQLFGK